MICKFCGAENPDGATVCGNCNNYLVEEYVEETPVMPKAAKILGIVSLVFSILAVPGTCLVLPGVISWLVALITSIIAKKKAKAVGLVSKPAKAAFIISIVELVLVVVGVLILVIAGGGVIAAILGEFGM